MKTYIRSCTMLDILSVYDGVCQDERDEIAALDCDTDASEVAYVLWGRGVLRWCIADSETLQAVAVFGLHMTTTGVYRAWMLCRTDAFERDAEGITQLVGHTITELFKSLDARRFEIVVLARRLLAQRWYAKLGFKRETVLRGYGTEDFSLFGYYGESS